MGNGTGLRGCGHSSESSIIFHKPGDESYFYIFTLDAVDTLEQPGTYPFCLPYQGFRFSEIDMTLQNGLGEVVSKNTFLYSPSTEKLCAIRHFNGRDVWVITHELNSNRFVSYLVTNKGINTNPIFSIAGDSIFIENSGGYMKASPDGSKLAVVQRYKGIDLFYFDNLSGIVYKPIRVFSTASEGARFYGIEFSPDLKKLYFSYIGLQHEVYQADISSGNPDSIRNSIKLIYHENFTQFKCNPAHQLGPDGKIYITRHGEHYLDVIKYPNKVGIDCEYIMRGFNLSDKERIVEEGLPIFIRESPPILHNINLCEGDTLYLKFYSKEMKVKWTGPNGYTSNETNVVIPNVTKKMSGFYKYQLSTEFCYYIDSISVKIYPKPASVIKPSDTVVFCQGKNAILFAYPDEPGNYYMWSTGETSPKIWVYKTGKYSLTVENEHGCKNYSEVYVIVMPTPKAKISSNTTLCESDSVILTAEPIGTDLKYQWSTGETQQKIVVRKAGSYWVKVLSNNGCSDSTSILIQPGLRAEINASGPTVLCEGDKVNLSASPKDPAYLYQWSTGETNQDITVNKTGVYSVRITGSGDCKDSAFIKVTVNPKPYVRIVHSGKTDFCYGDSVVLAADRDFQNYKWSSGENSKSIIAKYSGEYVITATDSNGCIASDSVNIYVSPKIIANIRIFGSTIFCDGDSSILRAEPSGSEFKYLWSTGDTSSLLTVKKTGKYKAFVSYNGNCGDSSTVDIILNSNPEVKISGLNTFCKGDSIKLSANKDFTSYHWSTGETTKSIFVNKPGMFSLAIIDSNGCKGNYSMEVKEFDINISGMEDLDFGLLKPGNSKTLNFTLKNESNVETEIQNISSKSTLGNFIIKTKPTLPILSNPGDTIDVKITFTPTELKEYTSHLILEIGKPCPNVYTSHLNGTTEAKTIIWLPDTSSVIGTDNFCIPLKLKKDGDFILNELLSYNAEIRFDASALIPENQPSTIISGERVLNLSGTNIRLTDNETNLNEICGLVLLPDEDKTLLRITSFDWSNPELEREIKNGTLTITGLCQKPLDRVKRFFKPTMQILPNPAKDEAEIRIKSEDDFRFSLKIFSIHGIEVFNEEIEIRNEELEINKSGKSIKIDLKEFSNGIYNIVLSSSGSTIIKQMYVIK